MDKFVLFSDRVSKKTWKMDENSAILTEKAAKDMGVSIGDVIQVELEDDQSISVTVTDICENYLSHYLYLAPQLYEKLTGEAPKYNCIFADVKEEYEDDLTKVGEKLLKNDNILTVSYTNNLESQLEDMLSVLDDVIVVLIISAGMLAFVVLYNLNNININERKRELATLKVLGFYDMEVGAYVYRENILLTLIGAIAGVFLGKLLHGFVVQTVEVEMTMFGRNINMASYLYAIAFTLLFSVLVNAAMYFKLKKINMVESLKSVE
jgi:putative ABC transport system permease protein